MFGSKLRSWMENHIVRPRKNRNKNKNGTSGNLATPNGHKGTSYQGDSTLGSPARRSEVSPIQNHTTSRVGWQLPQDNTIQMSPKSDHYPYRHMVKSTTSPKIVPHNKSSYSFDNTINNSNCSVGGNVSCGIGGGDNFSKSVDIKYNSKTMDYENRNCIKNGYQTSSSQQQKQSQQQQQQQHETFLTQQELKHSNNKKSSDISIRTIQSTTVTSSSSSSASILNIENRSLSKNNPKMMCNENHLSNKNRTDELKKKSTSSVIHQQQQQQQPQNGIVAGTTDNITELRPDNYGNKTNQLSGYDMSEIRFVNGKQKTVRSQNESKYGKILSTNRTTIPNGDSNIRHSNNNTNNCAKQQGVINTINSRNENNFNNNINNNNNNINNNSNNNNISNNTNNNNNNNNINNNNNNSNNNYQIPPKTPPQSHKPSSSSSYNTTNNQQNIKKHSSVIEQTTSLNSASVIGSVVGCKIVKNRNEIINNRNVMRTNRYSNCSTLSAPGHQSLSHMINTLSSPESAYSTGYSTDGTSPGASYTPEYYINIRTGTHYFPKAVGSVGAVDTGGNRLKYGGLNKIEETRQESIGNDMMHYHRRTESFDLGRNIQTKANLEHMTNYKNQILPAAGMSPILQKNLAMQNYKGIESPSPRQRCRIRTNPWFSNTDTSSSSITSFPKRNELDSGSTSSGIRSSSDAGTDEKNKKNGNKTNHISSDSETSSSTEKDFSIKTFSPNTIRRRKTEIVKIETKEVHSICVSSSQQESDEDATLNEMMGKFDESYVYEKETDILSDSDPTDCPSDLDTGQDAEDECDTDELLDIDYIDTGSIQEIVDKDIYKNTGSCSYHNFQQDKRSSRTRRSRKQDEGSSKRRKKLTRKKKSTDCNNSNTTLNQSPLPLTPRGCRSVGGTPVSLRRNQSDEAKRQSHMAPLTNRSNSLTFTEIHSVRSRVMAIAESEKALLRADLEADVKYKQLIHEAETILVSLKTNVRETPVASPRRVCNVPTNKRVEMLRNCEVDLKRELAKTQNPKPVETTEKSENLLLNKRLEILRFETASAPNSPKACRFSPRKTHVTNFMNQNASTTELMRRKSIPDPIANAPSGNNSSALSPRLQLNGRTISPPKSPTPVRRRFRSQSPKCYPDSSDSEEDSKSQVVKPHKRYTKGGSKQANKEPTVSEQVQAILSKTKSSHKKQLVGLKDPDLKKKSEITTEENYTLTGNHSSKVSELEKRKPPLMTFRSIDIGNRSPEFSYCPQSEPLKRKIYTCSSTFDKIQKSLDIESDIPKKALLNKISLLRKERRANKNKLADQIGIQQQEIIINPQETEITNDDPKSNSSDKRQLILDTIEDLKRSLEDQSVELYGLNDNEE